MSGGRTVGLRVGELQFFGLPEYDPEAHGTDVSSTPSPMSLIRTSPTCTTTDRTTPPCPPPWQTSLGTGVTGTPSGGVGFDTTYKAFTFDGVDDKITATLTNPAGAWVHSIEYVVQGEFFECSKYCLYERYYEQQYTAT